MCGHNHRYRDYEERREHRAPDRVAADVRVSDADRQRVIDQLRRHTADGRLTLDEFETRVGGVWAATNHGELRVALRDLPRLEEPRVRRSRSRQGLGVPLPVLILALVVAGSLVLGHFAWWLIPVGFWAFGACGVHRERYVEERPTSRDEVLTSV